MSASARRLSLINDDAVERAWREAPGDMVAEIVDGELSLQPRPSRAHAWSASVMGARLGPPFMFGEGGGPGGWVILDEPQLWLGQGPDKLVPDLAGWRRERLSAAVASESEPPYFDIAPDWTCEIVSPGTERLDRGKKMRIYAREGVGHLWMLSPLAQTLEVYRLHGQKWMLLDTHEGNDVVSAEPFEALELRLAELWGK